jgi:hypothetical protein
MAEYQSEMGYGKKWYVGVVRKSSFRTVFPREETERGIATSQRGQGEGSDSPDFLRRERSGE